MPPHLNYLILDKDQTIGEFPRIGLYPLVKQFLLDQHNSQKKLVIATTDKTERTKTNLQEINPIIHSYFCREDFRIQDSRGENIKDFYIDNKGNVRETKTTLTPIVEYQNPYYPKHIFKDLHLIRRYLSPTNHMNLRNIMIGDNDDGYNTPASDPFTPVIVINNEQREGHWQPITDLVDILYENPTKFPWQQFDVLYNLGQKSTIERELSYPKIIDIATIRLHNQTYELDKSNNGRRIVLKE